MQCVTARFGQPSYIIHPCELCCKHSLNCREANLTFTAFVFRLVGFNISRCTNSHKLTETNLVQNRPLSIPFLICKEKESHSQAGLICTNMDLSLYKYKNINLCNYHSIYQDEAKTADFIREEKANHICPNDGSERNFCHCEAVIKFYIIPSPHLFSPHESLQSKKPVSAVGRQQGGHCDH